MSLDHAVPSTGHLDRTETLTTDLTVTGMTCAACVSRVEKKLGRLKGVTATVNLATGTARVSHPADTTPEDLVAAVERAGYGAEPIVPEDGPVTTAVEDTGLVRLVAVALLALPVLALSMVPSWQFPRWQWLCFALTLPVATWGSWPFHARALRGLRHSAATMDTLVSLGVVSSLAWSTYALFFGGAGGRGYRMAFSLLPSVHHGTHIYLEGAVGVPLSVLLGRMLEARARRGTGSALRALAELGATDVTIRESAEGGVRERLVPIGELRVGRHFVVRPGGRVATDGVVAEGGSALDLSLVTGESEPVEVGPGSEVIGGALNAGGMLLVRATAVGAQTQLARITRLVTEAQAGKARAQRLADTVAGVFVPAVLALAVTVFGFWLGAGADPQAAVTAAVAVLVVACPCALGLATPTALLAATGRGARLGILVSGPRALESLREIDTVVLDKTGTLTTGRMSVVRINARPGGRGETAALRLAGAVEQGSEHPVGRAITAYAAGRTTEPVPLGRAGRTATVPAVRILNGTEPLAAVPDGRLPEVTGFRATAGAGVAGHVEGHQVEVGSPSDDLPQTLAHALAPAEASAHTCVQVTVDGTPEAVIALGDRIRPGSYRAVDHLRRLGLRPVLATGDREATARDVAAELGIDEVHSRCSPEDKAALVRELRAQGHRVAVLGDGVNDTAALAAADLGIAMSGGTDAAAEAADVTLVREDIQAVADAVRLARRTLRTIRTNLTWAFAYNAVTLPLAATGWLDPMPAAVAMSASSLLVVANSLRLRTWQPGFRQAPAAGPWLNVRRRRGPL